MRKQPKPPGNKSDMSSAVSSAIPQKTIHQVQTSTHVYQGPVPHPEILERFDRLVPGTAERMIRLAEEESAHRRNLESKTLDANISAQSMQLTIANDQTSLASKTDRISQVLGFVLSVLCILAATFLGLKGQTAVAIALGGIPTAGVIKAFFVQRKE